ncbi:MAG: DUF4339 domain-containing protein [Verrucomicrobiales bacterium]
MTPSSQPHHSRRVSLGGSGWYCRRGEQQWGPLEFRELREAALSGELARDDEVWEEGGSARAAGQVLGLFPAEKKAPPATAPLGPERDDLYAAPAEGSILQGPPGGLYLPHLRKSSFAFLIVLFGGGILLAMLAWQSGAEAARTTFGSFACILGLFGLFFALVYLHRAWEMMSMLGAQLRGGKAVAWLLLPFFNAIWAFVALGSWSRLWNRNVRTHPGLSQAARVFTPAFFLFPFAFLAAHIWIMIYWVDDIGAVSWQEPFGRMGLGIMGVLVLSAFIAWAQICRSINFLARKKS